MGTAYLTDPLLRLLDPEGMPRSFIALPDDEQMWRGRAFIMNYWDTHHAAYSWWVSLKRDTPEAEAGFKAFAMSVSNDYLAACLRGVAAEQRMAADGTLEEYHRQNEAAGGAPDEPSMRHL